MPLSHSLPGRCHNAKVNTEVIRLFQHMHQVSINKLNERHPFSIQYPSNIIPWLQCSIYPLFQLLSITPSINTVQWRSGKDFSYRVCAKKCQGLGPRSSAGAVCHQTSWSRLQHPGRPTVQRCPTKKADLSDQNIILTFNHELYLTNHFKSTVLIEKLILMTE